MKQNLIRTLSVVALGCILGTTPAYADFGDIGIGVKGGTLGVGAEVTVGLSSAFNLRSGFNSLTYKADATESDITYDAELKLSSIPVLLDYHPFDGSGFRLTAGALFNSNEVTAHATPILTSEIGDVSYTAEEIGSLAGKISFDDVAPFVGIGWGNAVGKDTGLSLALDLGVVLQGSPHVSLSSTGGLLSDNSVFLAELAKEEKNLQEETDGFKYYPVISLGLTYQF